MRRAVVDGPPTRATRQAREQEGVGGRDARDGQRVYCLRELQQRRHGAGKANPTPGDPPWDQDQNQDEGRNGHE